MRFIISKTLLQFFFLSIMLIFSAACRLEPKAAKYIDTEIQLTETVKVTLLDSAKAANAITKDDIDGFFDKIMPVDMLIQMKKTTNATAANPLSRDALLPEYLAFIQRDVADFTKEEKDFVAKTMAEAFALCGKVSPFVFPTEIKIIKSHGAHYGSDTYYTRENLIIVPKQALVLRDADTFLRVMLHEIAHIITRLNPSVKAKLYALIGFKKLDNALIINDSLRKRLLVNPDGVSLDWATELTTANGKNVFAMPLIYANDSIYRAEKPEFFQYLSWNYFELAPLDDSKLNKNSDKNADPKLTVLTAGKQQKSTLNTTGINDLFQKKFNTQYIIHPDEIVADNFSLLMMGEKNAKNTANLTPEGQTLLSKMRQILVEMK